MKTTPKPTLQLFRAILVVAIAMSWISSSLCAANTVEQWGIYEIELKGPTNGNPFVDVQLSAKFDNGSNKVAVPGFYDGDGVYRVRFMPEAQGKWHYETHANVPQLTGKTGEFTVTPPGKGNHGSVRVRNRYHFGYADGTPFRPFGTTLYEWSFQPEAQQQQTLDTLKSSPFNKARFLVIPNYRDEYHQGGSLALDCFPFKGQSRDTWDFSRPNPVFFQRLEKNVARLRDLGIQADLILFRPYDDPKWGFDRMGMPANERYLRYVTARLAAYRNVWWCMANEYSFMTNLTDADWDQLFKVLQASDPFNHLRSVQNADAIYNHHQPWITHVAMHNYMAVRYLGVSPLLRDIYRKPVIYDEMNYEGDVESRWGQLSSEEMTHRFWVATIGGTYATHGETRRGEVGDGWISRGGKLTRQSPARIAFLKKIVDQSSLNELEPIDPGFVTNMAGKPGRYYLIYFGKERLDAWPFVLPRDGLEPGMRFKADVIDTWNMQITPLDQTFEVERVDNYTFRDKDKQVIPLPGKPCMAVRIERLDN